MRRPQRQLAFAFDLMIPAPKGQESEEVYLAVRSLRWDGDHVYRAGVGLHNVNGRTITTRGLISLATSVKRDIAHFYAMQRLGFDLGADGYLHHGRPAP